MAGKRRSCFDCLDRGIDVLSAFQAETESLKEGTVFAKTEGQEYEDE